MKTYLINLDANPDRLGHMKETLGHLGMVAERIPGIYGRELDQAGLARHCIRWRSFVAMQEPITPGQIGCALSHVSVYRRMIDGNVPVALILEDDIDMDPGFPVVLERAAAFMDPLKRQVLVFSAWKDGRHDPLPGIVEESRLFCADAYCITLPAARLLAEINNPVIVPADEFERWHRWHGLELYRIYPTTVRQRNDRFGTMVNDDACAEWKLCGLFKTSLRVLDWLLLFSAKMRRTIRGGRDE